MGFSWRDKEERIAWGSSNSVFSTQKAVHLDSSSPALNSSPSLYQFGLCFPWGLGLSIRSPLVVAPESCNHSQEGTIFMASTALFLSNFCQQGKISPLPHPTLFQSQLVVHSVAPFLQIEFIESPFVNRAEDCHLFISHQ